MERPRSIAALAPRLGRPPKVDPMTLSTLKAPQLLRVGRASDLTRAVDEHGQREFMGAETYWI